jgi:hypothetical protein
MINQTPGARPKIIFQRPFQYFFPCLFAGQKSIFDSTARGNKTRLWTEEDREGGRERERLGERGRDSEMSRLRRQREMCIINSFKLLLLLLLLLLLNTHFRHLLPRAPDRAKEDDKNLCDKNLWVCLLFLLETHMYSRLLLQGALSLSAAMQPRASAVAAPKARLVCRAYHHWLPC